MFSNAHIGYWVQSRLTSHAWVLGTVWIFFCSFQVGHGTRVLNESIIVEWTVPKQFEVKYIGFSTGWGSMGEFKIWRKEETDENHNEAFTLGVPHNIIPGSERATASIIGINYEEVSLGTSYQIQRDTSICYLLLTQYLSNMGQIK